MCLGKLLSILIRLVFQCEGNQFGISVGSFGICWSTWIILFPILGYFVFDKFPMKIRIYPILHLRVEDSSGRAIHSAAGRSTETLQVVMELWGVETLMTLSGNTRNDLVGLFGCWQVHKQYILSTDSFDVKSFWNDSQLPFSLTE